MEPVLADELGEVVDKLRLFEKMYNLMRLVDPLGKKVVEISNGITRETSTTCYDFWQRNEVCKNCISMRALREKETFVKVDYSPQAIFMVSAIPLEVNGNTYVVEVMKDVTHSMFFAGIGQQDSQSMVTVINELQSAVIKDPLTGVYNKRFVAERLPAEILAHTLQGNPLTVILADIDRFKSVNDRFGHVAGDQVLKQTARVFESCVRGNQDWVARYGGEEFLICLTNADIQIGGRVAEKMRQALENEDMVLNGTPIKVTASFGVAMISEVGAVEQSEVMEKMLDCADKKMYTAKETGRNRVVDSV